MYDCSITIVLHAHWIVAMYYEYIACHIYVNCEKYTREQFISLIFSNQVQRNFGFQRSNFLSGPLE